MRVTSQRIFCACIIAIFTTVGSACADTFDYSRYQAFLDRYVIPDKLVDGIRLAVVDYKSINRDRRQADSLYDGLLAQLRRFDPAVIEDRDEAVAFWINAYNIGAIKMIIDHYPVESIRSLKINWLKNPWHKEILTIGGDKYSLGQIEHDILIDRYGDPMIHFSIVCASLSCPDLSRQVYRGAVLGTQMAQQARRFVNNDTKGLRIDREEGTVYFSKIFKFDEQSFPRGAADALPLIIPFVETSEAEQYLRSGRYRIEYLDYDWDLNTSANAGHGG